MTHLTRNFLVGLSLAALLDTGSVWPGEHEHRHIPRHELKAARALKNPLPATPANIRKGEGAITAIGAAGTAEWPRRFSR